jgi:hypothetical protein
MFLSSAAAQCLTHHSGYHNSSSSSPVNLGSITTEAFKFSKYLSPDLAPAIFKMGAGLSTHHDVPQLLIRTKNTTVSLKDVPNEILFHILGYLDESPEELEAETLPQTQRNDCYRTHPLGALSMTNKYLRDACLPFLYQEIFLQGEVYHIWSRLGDIGRLPITKHQMIK